MKELTLINNQNKISARQLYDFLELAEGQFSRWAKHFIIENEYAVENDDYIGFDINVEGNIVKDYELNIHLAKKLCMISKSQKGEQARNYFIAVEEKLKEISKPQSIEDLIIMQAQSVKELKSKVLQLETTTQVIKDTVATHTKDNWRETINKMMNKIVESVGGKKFQELRSESYKLLESRARVDLDARLRNYKTRLFESGTSKTKINTANKLDIIEQDVKLKEIYSGIIKEFTIKYVA